MECEGIVKKMFTSPAILSAVASVLEEVKENAADDVGETKVNFMPPASGLLHLDQCQRKATAAQENLQLK